MCKTNRSYTHTPPGLLHCHPSNLRRWCKYERKANSIFPGITARCSPLFTRSLRGLLPPRLPASRRSRSPQCTATYSLATLHGPINVSADEVVTRTICCQDLIQLSCSKALTGSASQALHGQEGAASALFLQIE
ncbi:hypothetical protein E2C01_046969 [Portunus trituberculatus]|uniref:Uncharacterized protein n=1 Tax=Portunus trituberculatus TaxID=210409 RepID=A0A5B7G6N3_PORTR|nr:hypothetical protein [Portunus trituberculatus]